MNRAPPQTKHHTLNMTIEDKGSSDVLRAQIVTNVLR